MDTMKERATVKDVEHAVDSWLRAHRSSILLTDPIDVAVPWLVHRVHLSYSRGGSLVDLGGGVSPANGFLSEFGMHVTVIDLLNEYYPFSTVNSTVTKEVEYLAKMGVKFVEADLTSVDLRSLFDRESIDVVASYHTIEHLHHSPKVLLESALDILKPGGRLVIEVPNAANLIKRAGLLIGRTNYPSFSEFYDSAKWCGHIREYTADDLEQLAQSLSLRGWRIEGRNWYGRLYNVIGNRPAARALDSLLRVKPGLCGSMFLTAQKPSAPLCGGARQRMTAAPMPI
jgi:SAM-dependent methyltransferase